MDGSMDHAAAIERLEERLTATDRREAPVEWAMAAYSLGLAKAESPVGPPEANLRSALALY